MSRHGELRLGGRPAAIGTGEGPSAVGATTPDLVDAEHAGAEGVPQRHEEHAMVHELRDGSERGGLLPAALCARGEEHARGLAVPVGGRVAS